VPLTPAELLERSQWDTFWVTPDVTVVDRPDLLLLSVPRPVPLLNTVLRTRAEPRRLPALIAEAEVHYRGRRARWLVADTRDRRPLEAALTRAGWAPADRHEVRTLAVADWTRSPRARVHAIDTMARVHDACDVASEAFGRPNGWTDEELARDLRQCTEGTRVHRFVAYQDDGRPIASGGLTAFPELGFGLLWAGCTVPDARGRGAYTDVLAARIERARALGLTTVGLYARVETSAPIVARMGFGHHGEMVNWERDVPA
jgi:hypothetical protein